MDLADSIRSYYFSNFDKLSKPRQFHFASRLAAWESSAEAAEKLHLLRDYMLPSSTKNMLSRLLQSPLGRIYEDNKRRPFFDKYAQLHGINLALFRLRHLKEIYGIDLRDTFWELVSRQELIKLNQGLRGDAEALRWLSSFAVNHLYLSELLFGDEFQLEPEIFLNASRGFDLDDPVQLNLNIYLFTHCIIADSNFYCRFAPAEREPVYSGMLGIMDRLVGSDAAKLDVELEYLVANRILGRNSTLEEMIYRRLPDLLSPEGSYLIERRNSQTNRKSNSLDASEHRNVLYIMSTSRFRPDR